MKGFITALALVVLTTSAHAQIKVPHGSASVMIDGRFEPQELQDAARLRVNDSINLYFKQDQDNLYWCLHAATPKPALVMADFYLSQSGSLLNLHASAQLGERKWNSNSYGDWIWWNNAGWTATVARIDKLEQRKFHRDEAKEFQLRKTRFSDANVRLMFEMVYPQDMVMKYPANADTATTQNWLQLTL